MLASLSLVIGSAAPPSTELASTERGRQRQGVAPDHPLLVGRDDPGGNRRAGRGDARAARAVRRRIEMQSEPGEARADAGAQLGGVLADAGGEDDGVDALE